MQHDEDAMIAQSMIDLQAAAEAPTRASIVRFINDEARKFERAYDEETHRAVGDGDSDKRKRLEAKASILRTMAAYIARSDDKVAP